MLLTVKKIDRHRFCSRLERFGFKQCGGYDSYHRPLLWFYLHIEGTKDSFIDCISHQTRDTFDYRVHVSGIRKPKPPKETMFDRAFKNAPYLREEDEDV